MAVDYAKLDRVMRGVRILVGLGLLSLTVVGPRSIWGFVGILPIVIGITGACPVSRLFGRKVCPTPTPAGKADAARTTSVLLLAAAIGAAGAAASGCDRTWSAEPLNIAMDDGFLGLDLPDDVRQVFVNNRAASLQNHLPAFENCA